MSAPSTRWLNQPQQRAWRAFLVGYTLLSDRLDDELRDAFGIGINEYEVLVRPLRVRGTPHADVHAGRGHVVQPEPDHPHHHAHGGLGPGPSRRRLDDGRGIVAQLTDKGYSLLVEAAPVHVTGVREHMVDLASDDDFAALGRVMDAVVDQLAVAHPEVDLRTDG